MADEMQAVDAEPETQVYNPDTQYPDGMPKVDDDGRKVVQLVATNEAGWRYAYEDAMKDGDALYSTSAWGAPTAAKAK